MKLKFAIVAALATLLFANHASAQIGTYGEGYENAFNIVMRGQVSPSQNSTYQNTILTAEQNGETDYYDGLLQGATDAWAVMQGKLRKPANGSYVSFYVAYYYYTVTTYSFTFSDGSTVEVDVSPNIE